MKADMLGKPITTLNVTEAGCLGVAMLACAADTGEPLASLAVRWVKPVARVAPQPAASEFYTQRFALYRALYPTLQRCAT